MNLSRIVTSQTHSDSTCEIILICMLLSQLLHLYANHNFNPIILYKKQYVPGILKGFTAWGWGWGLSTYSLTGIVYSYDIYLHNKGEKRYIDQDFITLVSTVCCQTMLQLNVVAYEIWAKGVQLQAFQHPYSEGLYLEFCWTNQMEHDCISIGQVMIHRKPLPSTTKSKFLSQVHSWPFFSRFID